MPSDKPRRVQLKRTKGWKMPPNTVKVTRPGRWGNPFIVSPKVRPGSGSGTSYIAVPTVEDAVECFRLMCHERGPEWIAEIRAHLGGRNLACFCKPGEPCHADVLLDIANG